MRLRNGRKVGRTLYVVNEATGDPDTDRLVGMVDTIGLAEMVAEAFNARQGAPYDDGAWVPIGRLTPDADLYGHIRDVEGTCLACGSSSDSHHTIV